MKIGRRREVLSPLSTWSHANNQIIVSSKYFPPFPSTLSPHSRTKSFPSPNIPSFSFVSVPLQWLDIFILQIFSFFFFRVCILPCKENVFSFGLFTCFGWTMLSKTSVYTVAPSLLRLLLVFSSSSSIFGLCRLEGAKCWSKKTTMSFLRR